VKMVHNGIEYGDMQLICEVCKSITRRTRACQLIPSTTGL
jgi:6-phosphogluconate dehydrogenase